MIEVVVFIGLQASGKTTFYRARFAETHVHVSKDNFPNAAHKDRRQARLVEEALRASRSVVVDNTHASRASRAPVIALARSLGARVIAYYFESRIEPCRARNALREGSACVPEVALRATARALERPDLNEGFDERYYVAIVGDAFDVRPWAEP